jgi:hypothetical protein
MLSEKDHIKIAETLRGARKELKGKKQLDALKIVLWHLESAFVEDNAEFRIVEFEKTVYVD